VAAAVDIGHVPGHVHSNSSSHASFLVPEHACVRHRLCSRRKQTRAFVAGGACDTRTGVLHNHWAAALTKDGAACMGLMTILCGPRALHLWERVTSRGGSGGYQVHVGEQEEESKRKRASTRADKTRYIACLEYGRAQSLRCCCSCAVSFHHGIAIAFPTAASLPINNCTPSVLPSTTRLDLARITRGRSKPQLLLHTRCVKSLLGEQASQTDLSWFFPSNPPPNSARRRVASLQQCTPTPPT
jgi:hypothetical protein